MKILLALLLLALPAFADDVATTLTWDANPEPDVASYRLYVGFAKGVYGTAIPVSATQHTVQIPRGQMVYAAVSAVNTTGGESLLSTELVFQSNTAGGYTIPSAPKGLKIQQQ